MIGLIGNLIYANPQPSTRNCMPPSPRILICRLSAVGDCILTTPLLCALRNHYPQAFITWVVEQGAAPLLRGHRCLDELIVLPKGWLKSPRTVWNLRQKLRSLHFDVALDPQSLTKSSMVAWLSGASRRIGFAKPLGRELSVWLNNERVEKTRDHVVDHQLELLRPLGIESPAIRFDLPSDSSACAILDAFLSAPRYSGGFAAINPGAGWDSRLWPTDRYARVARHLGEQHRISSIVTWAGPREETWANEIVAGSRGHALMAPRTSLCELADLLGRASLFVGSDTGPLHIAAAKGTRCVALHGTTRREQSGPYGPRHTALQEYYQAGSSRERRRAGNDAMLAITVEQVCAACDQMLAHRERRDWPASRPGRRPALCR